MKIILAFLFAVSTIFNFSAISAEDSKAATTNLWNALRTKIELFKPQYKIHPNNAVSGVLSTPVDSSDLYWKGEAVRVAMDATELADFKKAIESAARGETSRAQAAFSEFIKNYPNSKLRKDAVQALAALAK
jgi:TolA-binding protein